MKINNLATFYIVRHGESETNVMADLHAVDLNEVYGEAGPPLTDTGKLQAEEIASRLQNVQFDAYLASDLLRSIQTAEIIAQGRGSVSTYEAFRERNYGEQYEKLTRAQRLELEEALYELNDEEKFDRKFFPDGESAGEAARRFKQLIQELTPLYRGKTVLLVSHGNIMRLFLIAIKFVKQYIDLPSGSIKNVSYFRLETDGETFTVTEVHNITPKQNPYTSGQDM